MDIYEVLRRYNIAYQRFDHEPVYTCAEANSLEQNIPGAKTKNLFLRDRKGKHHFLVIVSDEKSVDFNMLSNGLNVNRLSLASPTRLKKYLLTEPGSVSILDIVKDQNDHVQLVIDQDVWNAIELQCHPYVNTSTLVIKLQHIKALLGHLNREARIYVFNGNPE
ncbi:prolyl-tRNA synthetase associated domain-containing protein [Vibrio sp. B1FLJ16]|uniref:prolyl-tRNA synthetase associated domain-containing protein n=1 Tax=Vibrio sp. B1FLJ16 TaxID=2751178 RepID=UPI0015F4170D|nr:prolyl-tRNA synthetase associated domain-containing protein [Vibrio sp. B1FLJ16]CAD7818777.1 Prolyl-tRNA editing protein ProX [Vibrio sp. B1FLJ16]CAE6936124.1 Prolyl-tRNA editing protein ProX [Vibrio sp. B1FLJ16]